MKTWEDEVFHGMRVAEALNLMVESRNEEYLEIDSYLKALHIIRRFVTLTTL